MCSITALLGITGSSESHRDLVLRASSRQHHCGPDWSGGVQTPSAASTVPGGKSVACSTEKALEWDARLQHVVDPSGRAVTDIHADAYRENQDS